MTVASAGRDFGLRSKRTRSSNSSGKVETKMAISAAANSTTVASRNLVCPPRSAVTCTGTRAAATRGKNLDNCSAQLRSTSGNVKPMERFKWPLEYTHETTAEPCPNGQYTASVRNRQSSAREECTCDAKEMCARGELKSMK